MFRAGKLAELEEIRETALTTIVGKMQCHARIAIVKLDLYNAKKREKQAFACLQRNIRWLEYSAQNAPSRRRREGVTDRRTDGPTDGPTDTPSYRDATAHLKKNKRARKQAIL